MSLLTRILAILLAVAAIAGGLALRGGRREAARAILAEQRLALSQQAQGQLQAALEAQQRGMEALRRQRQAQEARLRTADRAGVRTRREGEARAQAALLAPAPEDSRELARWAASQAQALNRRLEEAPR